MAHTLQKLSQVPLPGYSIAVQYSMERKSTKGCLNWPKGHSGYELKVLRELFESKFRVLMIFFLSVIDSNTGDKIRTIRA